MDQFIPCQNCAHTVNRFLEVCPYCAGDPGGDRSDKPTPLPPMVVGVPTGRFRPLQSISTFTQLLFGLYMLGSVVNLFTALTYRSALLDMAVGRPSLLDDFSAVENRYLGAIAAVSLFYLVLSAAFVTWFWRAFSNLTAMGRSRTRGTGWALGAWVIPIAGLIIPYGIGAEIWTQSRPEPGPVNDHRDPNMEPVISWWALFVIMSVVNQVGLFLGGDGSDATELAAYVGVDFVGSVVSIAAAIAAVRYVRLVTERQERLHHIVGVPILD